MTVESAVVLTASCRVVAAGALLPLLPLAVALGNRENLMLIAVLEKRDGLSRSGA